jgi:hypothetical protein
MNTASAVPIESLTIAEKLLLMDLNTDCVEISAVLDARQDPRAVDAALDSPPTS